MARKQMPVSSALKCFSRHIVGKGLATLLLSNFLFAKHLHLWPRHAIFYAPDPFAS